MANHGEPVPNEDEFNRRLRSVWHRDSPCGPDSAGQRCVLYPLPPRTLDASRRRIPRAATPFGSPSRRATQQSSSREENGDNESDWILVIDDVPVIRSVLNRLLRRQGYNVVDAPNLDSAYRQFGLLSVRVLVLDLIIPGYEPTSSFSSTLRCFPKATAIAMSGGGRCGASNLLSVAESLGAAATLSKPFATRQLLDLVERLWAN
ncbi:MAG: CheY-like chemotaxis protein [Planctomycetota bacterium]|jgi:CheY-like chemotaxis protein